MLITLLATCRRITDLRMSRMLGSPRRSGLRALLSHQFGPFFNRDLKVADLVLDRLLENLEAFPPEFLGQPAELLGALGLGGSECVFNRADACPVLGVQRLAMLGHERRDDVGPLLLERPGLLADDASLAGVVGPMGNMGQCVIHW